MSGERPDMDAILAYYQTNEQGRLLAVPQELIASALADIPALVEYAEALEAALGAILQAYATVDLEQQHAAMQAARALLGEG